MRLDTPGRFVRRTLPFTIAVLLTACAADGSGEADDAELPTENDLRSTEDLTLLAEVSDTDRTVRFYEAEPGHIIEIERGKAGASAPEPQGLNSVQRYAFLAGREPPSALVAAQARVNAAVLRSDDGNYSPKEESDTSFVAPARDANKGGTEAQPAPDQTWFRNNYCWKTDRNFFGLDLQTAGYWRATNVNYRKSGVFCSAGQIYVGLNYATPGTFGISNIKGEYGWLAAGWYIASRESSNRDATVTDEISQVEPGDKFDYCVNYHY